MADVNLQLVREFFELNVFHVLTNWQQFPFRQHAGARNADRSSEPSPHLFVENTAVTPALNLPFVLHPADIPGVERAIVMVRAWHGDRCYPSVIEANPALFQVAESESLALAREVFGNRPFATILVVSELPASAELRARSVHMLEESGLGHVIEFPSILQDLLNKVSLQGNYAASPTLQVLRLLKRYKLIRHQQLEFPFPDVPPAGIQLPSLDDDDGHDTEYLDFSS